MGAFDYPDWETFMKTSFAGRYDLPMVAPETPSFMQRPVAKTAADLEGADVVIIGAPYVAAEDGKYAGVPMEDWIEAPKRVRQQSARYPGGYIQDFDLDLFEHIRMVDYGDADIPREIMFNQTPENILKAQAAVEAKCNDAIRAGAVPVVIGQNSPCGSFAIAKACSENVDGMVGCVSLDTHWDAQHVDYLTGDPRIAGAASWKHKMYEFLDNMHPRNLVEIGERGMLENKDIIRRYLREGSRFISSWELRTSLGIEGVVKELDRAWDGTQGVYAHFDMDVMGGAGPAPGDILGELVEPIAMTDYECIRIAHEIGRRGLTGFSFICIPPGSAAVYRVIVYIIVYMAAGLAMRKIGRGGLSTLMASDNNEAEWPDRLHRVLKDAGVTRVSHVPDAGHARLISLCENDAAMVTNVLTTEEEGIAIAAGAWLGGASSVLLLQSSGVGNCINMLSLPAIGRFPLLMLVTMRGEWAEFNPWQVPMGSATQTTLEAMGVTVQRADTPQDLVATVESAAALAFKADQQVAVLISQRLLGKKTW